MNLINNITDDTVQTSQLILPDGSQAKLTLEFKPMQFGWFIRSLTYQNLTIEGRRLFVSPNILQQFCNQIPFGIACSSVDNREPSQAQDFSSGNCQLFLLTAAEVAAFTEFLSA